MNMRRSKKGLSPLIAAVLLIVVVVGIGAVVTGIVRNYVTEGKQTITEKASDMKCGVEISIDVPVVADELRICNWSNKIQFTLDNSGSSDIDDLQVKVFGTAGFDANDTAWTDSPTQTAVFETGDTVILNITFDDTAVGDIQQVKIVPRVRVVGRTDKAYCTDASLTFADFLSCS
ncbi:hypothetical protein KY349_01205 [Candidatus Woesearchaeota archaeon]|jgi:FlaG/FlaF family flagellin (archaellin)|nr:hypothetical protein [Candidatus Woesearchaeota archaeon]